MGKEGIERASQHVRLHSPSPIHDFDDDPLIGHDLVAVYPQFHRRIARRIEPVSDQLADNDSELFTVRPDRFGVRAHRHHERLDGQRFLFL